MRLTGERSTKVVWLGGLAVAGAFLIASVWMVLARHLLIAAVFVVCLLGTAGVIVFVERVLGRPVAADGGRTVPVSLGRSPAHGRKAKAVVTTGPGHDTERAGSAEPGAYGAEMPVPEDASSEGVTTSSESTSLPDDARTRTGSAHQSTPARRVLLPLSVASSTSSLSADCGRLGPVRVYAASAVGQRHVADAVQREDAYALASVTPTTCAVAVADGLGSAFRAHLASLACAQESAHDLALWAAEPRNPWPRRASDLVVGLSQWLARPDALDAFEKTLFVAAGADQRARKTAPPATTLAAAAVRQTEVGSSIVNWFVYGDATVMRLADRRWEWQSAVPDLNRSGTDALPGSPGPLSTGELHLGPGELVVLATDGFAEAVAAHGAELGRVVTDAVSRSVSAAVFATMLDFDIDGLYDDKTVVVLGG